MSYSYALDGYYDDLIPAARGPRIDRRFVAAFCGVLVLSAAVLFGVPRAVEAYRGYQAATIEAEAARTTVELPREWRWEPQPVKYEHMFRTKR